MIDPEPEPVLSRIVRAGRNDDLALALRLIQAATDLALKSGASRREVEFIRGLANQLGAKT